MIVVVASAGHAGMPAGLLQVPFIANYALHLAAGAAWVGGLLPLGLVLRQEYRRPAGSAATMVRCLERFSKVGLAAVATLVATGSVNVWLLVGSPAAALASDWGRVLVLKLGLFAVLLGCAAMNRLWLLPRLRARPVKDRGIIAVLIGNVMLEQGLGLLVIAAASVLGTLAPPLAP